MNTFKKLKDLREIDDQRLVQLRSAAFAFFGLLAALTGICIDLFLGLQIVAGLTGILAIALTAALFFCKKAGTTCLKLPCSFL